MPGLGTEYGCPFVLEGPDGSRAVFNDSADEDYVGILNPEECSGLDSADVREDLQALTEADGAVQGNNWYGARPVVLGGTIIASSKIDRNKKVAKLKAASNAMRGDATLTWEPPELEGEEVSLTLRRQQPLRVTKGYVKMFQAAMVSASAEILGATKQMAKTYKYKAIFASQTKSPGTTSETARGGDSATWSNTNNIKAEDSSYANTTSLASGYSTNLRASNYGFGSFPEGATLLGIGVRSRAYSKPGDGPAVYDRVRLAKAAVIQTIDRASKVGALYNVSAAFRNDEFGGEADLWDGFTLANVENSGFGVAISLSQSGAGPEYARIDHVPITVWYKSLEFNVTHEEEIENEGDASTYPVITVTGPAPASLELENKDTGETIKYEAAAELAEGEKLIFDLKARTVVDGAGVSKNGNIVFAGTTWWGLAPGKTKVVLPPCASLTIDYAPAWL